MITVWDLIEALAGLEDYEQNSVRVTKEGSHEGQEKGQGRQALLTPEPAVIPSDSRRLPRAEDDYLPRSWQDKWS